MKRRRLPSEAAAARRAGARNFLLALPALAFLTAVFYIPLAQVFAEAFLPTGPGGMRPIAAALRDPYVWQLLRFTALQALYSALGSLVLGFPLGYVLANRTFPGKRVVQAVTLVPFVLPSIAVALGFLVFFGHNGLLNRLLAAAFGVRLQILYSLWAIVLAHAFYNAPVVARAVHAAWSSLDPAYEEAARSLGAGPAARLATVVLPLIIPGVITGTLLAFIFSFFSFSLVLALGGSRFATLEVAIYTQVRVLLDHASGSALAMLQTLFSLLTAYAYLGVERRFLTAIPGGRPRPCKSLAQPTALNVLLWLYLLLLALFYLGPAAAVVEQSLRGAPGELSLEAYRRVLFGGYDRRLTDTPARAVRNSLLFASGALAVALPLGILLAYALAAWRRGGRDVARSRLPQVLETLGLAPLTVSSVAFGFAALRAFRTGPLAGLSLSPEAAITLVHAVLVLPFILRTVRPAFERLDRSWTEAARSLGATRRAALRDVELPLVLSAVLVGAGVGFALSLSEMSATIMLARPGLMTLPLSVYHHLAARDFPAAAAMSVVLAASCALALLGMEILARRAFRRRL